MYSIIIPTYNHCDDLLRPCLESIVKYTSNFEIIVVANGCTDETKEYMTRVSNFDPRFKLIFVDEALGYTKATNLGIQAATGDFIILMNNDTVLLEQSKDQWLELLTEPFKDPSVGITGPVKFHWQVAGIKREAMAFWLVMIKREVIDKIGLLDELFSPGMGEDGDFCIRATQAGYKLISVPHDVSGGFQSGIVNFGFPIWHKGNGTFADDEASKVAVIDQNNLLLSNLFGIGDYFTPAGYVTNPIIAFNDLSNSDEFQREVYQKGRELAFKHGYLKILDIGCGSGYKLINSFEGFTITGIDRPEIVEELKNRYTNCQWISYDLDLESTLPEALQGEFDLVICSDVIEHLENPDKLIQLIQQIKFKHLILSTPDRSIIESRGGSRLGPPSNTFHVREWSKRELKRYIENNSIKIEQHFISNEKQATQLMVCTYSPPEISIVIPTYNHFEDAFKPCIDAVLANTSLHNKEIIVVANGCKPDDLTRTYLEELGDRGVRYVWIEEPAGYIGAVNAGIDVSLGRYIVLLDNDSHLLPQQIDQWIDILQKPFLESENVGATSPFANEYEDMGFVLHSGCTMYDADLLRKIGKFDTIYMPGYFSDSDVSMKIWSAGYRCVEVPIDRVNKEYTNGTFTIQFPVVHTGLIQTMDKNADIEILKKNREILYSRHGTKNRKTNTLNHLNAKYSIIIPTYNHCDDLLRPCLESIFKYSNMDEIEIIVVANGCTDNTHEYLSNLNHPMVKWKWIADAVGYTVATNAGIKEASAPFIVLLNNDTELLEQPKNKWLDMIVAPFDDSEVGLSGPLMLHDDYADVDAIIFFCAMIRRSVFEKVGLLDEIFTPGGGEDIDFAARVRDAGFKIVPTTLTTFEQTNVGGVPIWHKDNQTFKDIPEYTNHIVKRNGLINCKRYNKNIKLNLGSGGVPYKGYLSVDLYDQRAHVQMDITKLEFDDNSVSEILASHVFEHLNPYHSIAILQDWLRVLKPGGKLIMEMPDIEQLCKRFVTASTGERYGILNAIYGSVNTTNVGGPDNITSPHLFGWWPQSLWDHLTNAGFTNIEFMNEKIPHPESNLRVEAIKPSMINRESLKRQEPATYHEIFDVDSYQLTESQIRDKLVIDVGANLGMFSLRCLELGATRVLAIEAQPVVFTGLMENVKTFSQIIPMNAAVLDVDGKTVTIKNEHVGSKVTTDGEGDKVNTVTLKTLIDDIDDTDMVLKLDCEGSEFDILLNVEYDVIRHFAVIHMEVHANTNENPEYQDIDLIHKRLTEFGYMMVNSMPVLWFGDDGSSHEIGVYVEKWVRK